jgi:hypothetical protein
MSWDGSAAAIASSGAERLVFLLDNPVTAAGSAEQHSRVAGFFAQRRNDHLVVEAVALGGRGPQTDPNHELARVASRSPRAGIVWMYNRGVKRDVGRSFSAQSENSRRLAVQQLLTRRGFDRDAHLHPAGPTYVQTMSGRSRETCRDQVLATARRMISTKRGAWAFSE